jgi:hypothetical protein
LVAAAVALAIMNRHRCLHTITLVTAAIAWGIVASMMQVAGIMVAANHFRFDLSTGWPSDFYGLVLLGAFFALVLSTDRILWVLLGSAEDPYESESTVRASEQRVADEDDTDLVSVRLGFLRSWTVAGMFACLGLMQVASRPQFAEAFPVAVGAQLLNLDENSLPAQLAGWQRRSFQSQHHGAIDPGGEFTATWHYEQEGREAVISLDFPLAAWRDPIERYRQWGNVVLSSRVEHLPDCIASFPSEKLAVISLELEHTRRANVLLAQWDTTGKLLEPPDAKGFSLSQLLANLRRRARQFGWPRSTDLAVYQLQVFCPSRRLPDSVNEAAARRLFAESLELLRRQTMNAEGGAS